ncbi:hypothetical protein N9025_02250 [Synechococcus sp. AH-707-B22]|nr:hypothetical protein [Synechococcus sp. AH-707-B22]
MDQLARIQDHVLGSQNHWIALFAVLNQSRIDFPLACLPDEATKLNDLSSKAKVDSIICQLKGSGYAIENYWIGIIAVQPIRQHRMLRHLGIEVWINLRRIGLQRCTPPN